MIIHQPAGLQEGIDDGGAAKREAARLQVFRDGLAHLGLGLHIGAGHEVVLHGSAIDELPEVVGKAFLLLDVQKHPCGGHHAHDLGAVAHDSRILHQRRQLLGRIAHHGLRIEAIEGLPEILALPQDGDPGQPCLKPVEHQFFEQRPVIGLGHAPVRVVIGHIERVQTRPRAARLAVGMQDDTAGGSVCHAASSPDPVLPNPVSPGNGK